MFNNNFFSSIFGYFFFQKKVRNIKNKKIVFFSESNNYRNYFIELIKALNNDNNITVLYITSDQNDLDKIDNNIKPIFIGKGFLRILLLAFIECDILIMTLTDLGNHEIKKSKKCKNYIYLFHSLVSTHKTYTKDAFKNYDIIFSNGDYQKKELEYVEKMLQFPKKKIFNTGYIYLDKLKREKKQQSISNTVLFAPSWNKSKKNLFDDYSESIISELIKNEYKVVLRTHPELLTRSSSVIKNLTSKFSKSDKLKINFNISDLQVLNESTILITDNGGMAMEYFLIQKKPVLFLNYQDKIHNSKYNDIKLDVIEDTFKKKFGFEINAEEFTNIKSKINEATIKFEALKNNVNTFAKEKGIILDNSSENAKNIIKRIIEM